MKFHLYLIISDNLENIASIFLFLMKTSFVLLRRNKYLYCIVFLFLSRNQNCRSRNYASIFHAIRTAVQLDLQDTSRCRVMTSFHTKRAPINSEFHHTIML